MKQAPEISINKLAEFVNATEKRKLSILKTIKSTNVEDITKRIRYATPKSALKQFLLDGKHDPCVFQQKRDLLKKREAATDFKKNDRNNSLIAIKKLEECALTMLKPYLELKSKAGLPKGKRNIKSNGVIVHLAPEILFIDKETEEVTGAIKLYFSKRALTPHEGQIISGIIRKHLEKEFEVKISLKNCFVLDVFAKRIFVAPDSFSYYNMRLKRAFAEIITMWGKVA